MNLTPFFEASIVIQVHAVFATISLLLGGFILWRTKGDQLHRLGGKIWVVSMLVVSFTGFFIHEIDGWPYFSPIHIFSVVVPVSLAYAIWAARQGNITEHRRTMQSVYVGGMVIAGGFTFLPGRLNHDIFFGGSEFDVFETSFGWVFPLVVAGLIFLGFAVFDRFNRY